MANGDKIYDHKHTRANLEDKGVSISIGPNILGQIVSCRIRTWICNHMDCDYEEITREPDYD